MAPSLKMKAGALLYDWPRFRRTLRSSRGRAAEQSWVAMRNRAERLEWSRDREGARCDWMWTSDLHIANVFPETARRLLRVALSDWPIAFTDAVPPATGSPDVTFVIGHRGLARLPLLLRTLTTIAAQQGAGVECIVVEQSTTREIQSALPSWVRYVHTPVAADLPYCRSWALNVGARLARGRVLVLQDNDLLLPQRYAAELLRRHAGGGEFIDLKRFTFYLAEEESRRVLAGLPLDAVTKFDAVVQNLQGASVAADREAYLAIGGFDEGFIGWGGEDNDFWDRARTRSVFDYGYLPTVHLWHAAQPEKGKPANRSLERYQAMSGVAPADRIARLVAQNWGSAAGPVTE